MFSSDQVGDNLQGIMPILNVDHEQLRAMREEVASFLQELVHENATLELWININEKRALSKEPEGEFIEKSRRKTEQSGEWKIEVKEEHLHK